jgi:hypothetical protein
MLYHPSNALEALEAAEGMGLLDFAFPSRYVPEDEIWISEDPKLIIAYCAIMEDQSDIVEKATIAR